MKKLVSVLMVSFLLLCAGCATTDRIFMQEDPVNPGQWKPSSYVEALQTGANFIPGWGQLAGAALGVLSMAYISVRKGKAINAMVDGVEHFRLKLRETPQGQQLDEQFLDLLKKIQDKEGVQNIVAKVVNKRTDYTRNPTKGL